MRKIIISIFLLIIFISTISFAEDTLRLTSNSNNIEVGEEVFVSIDLENTNIAALTLEIYWDVSRLEYISGPQNSNKVNNRIIYTWVSDNGENRENLVMENFVFKGLQNGIGNIFVTGEYFDSEGNLVSVNDSNIEIKIGKEEVPDLEQKNNVSDDNSNLAILRLNHEGISPEFDKDIKEYYFVTDMSINSLDIIAVPENNNSSVEIAGNTNLKMGENIIDIKVTSKDKTKVSIYKIFVTRTNNIETANANLETLAIRQGTLKPEYDENITKYSIDVGNNITKIDILAIPQNENAVVKILGDTNIKTGYNNIQIIVTAENGTTIKKYEINVHRRNEKEEVEFQEKQENQAIKLSTILEEKSATEENENKFIENNKESKKNIVRLVFFLIIILISTVFILLKRNKTTK